MNTNQNTNGKKKLRRVMLYFAYGSNLSKAQMKHRCLSAEEVCPAVADGYRLEFVGRSTRWDGAGVATMVPAEGSQVYGAIYRMTEADWTSLNGFEGVKSSHYKRTIIRVTSVYGGETGAAAYIASVGHRGVHPPSQKYLDTIKQGFIDWQLPLKALKGIKPIDTASQWFFVYGTLQQNEGNHRLLAGRFTEVRPAIVKGQLTYNYFSNEDAKIPEAARSRYDHKHGIPVMNPNANGIVYGQVFKVSKAKLAEVTRDLDGLEGVAHTEKLRGHVYERRLVNVMLEDTGSIIQAWAYPESADRRFHVTSTSVSVRRTGSPVQEHLALKSYVDSNFERYARGIDADYDEDTGEVFDDGFNEEDYQVPDYDYDADVPLHDEDYEPTEADLKELDRFNI